MNGDALTVLPPPLPAPIGRVARAAAPPLAALPAFLPPIAAPLRALCPLAEPTIIAARCGRAQQQLLLRCRAAST